MLLIKYINLITTLGWTPLHVAAINQQSGILKILLEKGADPDLGDEFVNIYQTAREKQIPSIDVMVTREEEFNSNLNLRANFRGCTALHYAALADDIESVKILLGTVNKHNQTLLKFVSKGSEFNIYLFFFFFLNFF